VNPALRENLHFKKILKQTATDLSGTARLPVPIAEIANSLGVKITRASTTKQTRGHLLLGTAGSEIVLPRASHTSDKYTPWERFLIAHELGHLVLDRMCESRPLGKSEYWQHEELCDTFARWLLLPPTVAKLIEESVRTPSQRLNLCEHLKLAGNVPWKTAAFRISECDHTTRFLLLRRGENCSFMVTTSTFPNKIGIRSLVKQNHVLNKTVSSLAIGDATSIGRDVLDDFSFAPDLKRAAAFRKSSDDVILVVMCMNGLTRESQV